MSVCCACVGQDSYLDTRHPLVPEDTAFATMNYTYDAEGRLTQRSEGTDSDAFTYSFGSQLTQIQKTRAGVVTQTLNYAYDGGGQRVKVTDSDGTRYFLYDGGMPVLELDGNKKITTSYLYGADGVVYRRKHDAVAHWHFDEGTGTLAHDVDGANHGTLGGGRANKTPTWSFGCGLLFDGINDLVKVPDSDGLDLAGDKITIAAWVQPHSAKVAPLVEKINKRHGYRISQIGTKFRFVLRRNGQDKTVTSTPTLPLHGWTHVAARYDGAQMRIFINGTIESATTAATGSLSATTAPVWIGGRHNHFHGFLDDVSIYNRALSDSEITDLVNDVDKRYEYHHVNALGSNIVSTDDNQNVLVRYEYDVFGAIRNETGTSDNTRKFTGKEFDADSNLYYYGARYYDPYIGRFTQRDPIGNGVNWYAYTANNPLTRVDRDGLLWETIVDIFGAGLSFYEFVKAPGWGSGAIFVYDLGAVFVPFVPGTVTGRIVAKVATDVSPSQLKKAFRWVRTFTKRNARKNLQRLTHGRHGKDIMKDYDAHHIIPTAVHDRLEEMGSKINPNRPEFLTWWKRNEAGGTHQTHASDYNTAWENFLKVDRTDNEILEFARTKADEYINEYWDGRYYFDLLQEADLVSPSQLEP